MCAQKRQILSNLINEPHRKKTGLRGFRPGPTHARLYSFKKKLEAQDFGFTNQSNRTIYVAKTRTMISCAVIESLFLHMENSVFLSETWISSKHVDNLELQNFESYHIYGQKTRGVKKGHYSGGISVYLL